VAPTGEPVPVTPRWLARLFAKLVSLP